jgi:hypothetical protein
MIGERFHSSGLRALKYLIASGIILVGLGPTREVRHPFPVIDLHLKWFTTSAVACQEYWAFV